MLGDEEEVGEEGIRDFLVLQDSVFNPGYQLGVLTVGDGDGLLINVVAITEVGNLVLVAVPGAVWNRQKKRRKFPT